MGARPDVGSNMHLSVVLSQTLGEDRKMKIDCVLEDGRKR